MAFYSLYYGESSQNNKNKILFFLLSGFIGGLAAICHPLLSVFFIAETIYQTIKKKFLYTAMLMLGGLLVVVPVISAKSIHYKKFTFIQSNGAFNFYLGNHKNASGTCELRPGLAWRKTHLEAEKVAKEKNISQDKYFWNKSKDFFLNNPIEAATLLGKKFLLVFSGRELISGADPAPLCYRTNIMYYGGFFTWVLLFLSIWGIFLALVRYDQAICGRFFRLYISTVIILTLTVVSGRYRVPIYPAVIFFATVAIYVKNRRLRLYLCIPVLFLGIYLYGAFPNNEHGQAKAILGEAKVIKKDYSTGLTLLKEAISLGVDDPANCYNLLGEIAESKGNYQEAEKLYKEIIKLEPYMPEAWMNLGNIASLNPKRYKEAGFYYNKALELDFNNADIHYNCGLFLLKLKQLNKSEAAFKKALELNNFHAPAANQLGIIAFNKKDFILAEKFFYKAYISNKSNQGYKNNLEVVKRILKK
jgi:Flp pilus assembly protein TadD